MLAAGVNKAVDTAGMSIDFRFRALLSWRKYGLKSTYVSSCRDDFNIKVLQAFVELHEFADLNLVQALR